MCTRDAWSGRACSDIKHSTSPPISIRSSSTRNKHFKSYLDEIPVPVLDGKTQLSAKDAISSQMVRGCMCVPKVKQHSQACAPLGSARRMLASAPNTPAVRTPHCLHSRNISIVRARSPFSRPSVIHMYPCRDQFASQLKVTTCHTNLFAIVYSGEAPPSSKHLGGSVRRFPRCAHATLGVERLVRASNTLHPLPSLYEPSQPKTSVSSRIVANPLC